MTPAETCIPMAILYDFIGVMTATPPPPLLTGKQASSPARPWLDPKDGKAGSERGAAV